MNKERSLAHIETITDIRPIEGKDRIVLAKVLGWNVVIGKDEFRIGDRVVYVEIDSRLNTNLELFQPLSKDADKFGFARIRTRKFGDSYSQGICFKVPEDCAKHKIGTDLTGYFNKGREGENIAIIHNEEYSEQKAEWENPWKKKPYKPTLWEKILRRIFPRRKRREKGRVPNPYDIGVSKTNEERIQNLTELFENLKSRKITLVATEKLDGQSFTAHIDRKGKVYVASRNVPLFFRGAGRTRQSHTYAGSTWKRTFEKYEIEKALISLRKRRKEAITIQGEIIGSNIQGNPYKVPGGVQLKVYNIAVAGKRIPYEEMRELCMKHNLDTVPYLGTTVLDENLTIEDFIAMSDGMSEVNKDTIREGIVYRTIDYKTSFKAISNKFLMKGGE